MVEICRAAGVPLMVNQQARWAPAHRAARVVIERGVLGHIYSVAHILRGFQDVPGSWYAALENFNIVDHGIHYIDLTRYFTGRTPLRVKATTTRVPHQAAVSPMIYSICMEYEPEAGVGDFVLVHVGFAIARIDREEAARAWDVLEQIGQTDEVKPVKEENPFRRTS